MSQFYTTVKNVQEQLMLENIGKAIQDQIKTQNRAAKKKDTPIPRSSTTEKYKLQFGLPCA